MKSTNKDSHQRWCGDVKDTFTETENLLKNNSEGMISIVLFQQLPQWGSEGFNDD